MVEPSKCVLRGCVLLFLHFTFLFSALFLSTCPATVRSELS
uniref:Uncharacterized protein n=1 Tax=Arundo donax TaxID=35708 RepID=A0A0A9BP74_ARUDO